MPEAATLPKLRPEHLKRLQKIAAFEAQRGVKFNDDAEATKPQR